MGRRPVQHPEGSHIENIEPHRSQSDMSGVSINHLQESGDEDRESSDTEVADDQANGDEDRETSDTEVTDDQIDGNDGSDTSDTELANDPADRVHVP